MLLRKCQDECSHLVLVRLSLGDGLAIVGVPLGGALGEPLALAILHHVDTLGQDFSCIYFSYKVVLWLWSYISFNMFSLWSYLVWVLWSCGHTFHSTCLACGLTWLLACRKEQMELPSQVASGS